jgi:hypothetical protein
MASLFIVPQDGIEVVKHQVWQTWSLKYFPPVFSNADYARTEK